MIKKNLKSLIISSLIILIPMVIGFVLWEQLPDQMATHFNGNGEADGWASKVFTVIALPLILVALQWFCIAFIGVDPKKKNISDKMITLTIWVVPMVSLFGFATTYLYALDKAIDSTKIAMILVGIMFVFMGNYLPKTRQSYTMGYKLPWTLESEENWNRTHRFAGWVALIGGVVMIVVGFLNILWAGVAVAAIIGLLPMVYSYLLYKKGI